MIAILLFLFISIATSLDSLTFDSERDTLLIFVSEIIKSICNNEDIPCINTINEAVRGIKVKISYEELLELQRSNNDNIYGNNIQLSSYIDKVTILQHISDDPNINTICEISDSTFGPSLLNFLISNPKANIISFHQINQINYQHYIPIILNMFPDRIVNIINGDFNHTITNFVKLFPLFKCNLIYIDNLHELNYNYYIKLLANNTFNRIIIDNIDLLDYNVLQIDQFQSSSTIKTIDVYNTIITPCIQWYRNNINGYSFNFSLHDNCNYSEKLNLDDYNKSSNIFVGKYVTNMTLFELIDNTRSDKHTAHSYIELYHKLFSNKSRTSINNILEIGINKGGSIILWHDYFFNSNIYAIDLINNNNVWHHIQNKNRIKLYTSQDAYNETFIQNQFSNIKFDIMIDDGPHTLESMIQFIRLYNNNLNNNGILIIEDVQAIEWIDQLIQVVPEHLKKYIKIYDRRSIKNRFDDILFTIDLLNNK
jgi:hypothetical protein